jgi:hypothetical protein
MTIEIKEKCCCGAEFYVKDTVVFGNSADYRYREFLEAHKICREMASIADSMRSKTTEKKIYAQDNDPIF